MNALLRIHEKDNVATCLREVSKGETLVTGDFSVQVKEDIPAFHKIAIANVVQGGTVFKYGEAIGKALTGIEKGDHVHVHNIESMRGRGDLNKEAVNED